MNKLSIVLIIGFWGLLLGSCEDVFVDDISGKNVLLISPTDSLITTVTSHTFWWEKVDGATKYTLQIARPSFSEVQKIVLDTSVYSDKFDYTLYPGTFQWRVKATNSVSETDFTTYTLTIDSTQDLSGETVNLVSPETNYATNNMVLTFLWQKVYNATEYRLKVFIDSWNGNLYKDTIIQSNSVEIELPEETLVWGVQARNDLPSQSSFSYQNLYVDTTSPGAPTLTTPQDEEIISSFNVNFSWNRKPNDGTSIKDSLVVSTDSIFTNDNIVLRAYTTNTEYTLDAQEEGNGIYYWHVASYDKAGNHSAFSDTCQFEIDNT